MLKLAQSILFSVMFLVNSPLSSFEHKKKQDNFNQLIDWFFANHLYMERTELCDIMTEMSSDKGSKHNYTTLYYHLFKHLKDKEINLFELGLGTNNLNYPSNMGEAGVPCASLFGWKRFFANAAVFGADIDRNILIYNDTIKTFHCDQTSPISIWNMCQNPELKDIKFDIIIDDGLHTYEANIVFFLNFVTNLKNGGFYIIEDITNEEAHQFISFFNHDNIRKKYEIKNCNLLPLPGSSSPEDNNLLIIEKY